jgi:hypothetical protein
MVRARSVHRAPDPFDLYKLNELHAPSDAKTVARRITRNLRPD